MDATRWGSAQFALTYQDADVVLEAPAFWVGVWFDDMPSAGHANLSQPAWQESLAEGLHVVVEDNDAYIGRWRYLSELVVAGTTFDEQIQALSEWAHQTIADIAALAPPPEVSAEPVT